MRGRKISRLFANPPGMEKLDTILKKGSSLNKKRSFFLIKSFKCTEIQHGWVRFNLTKIGIKCHIQCRVAAESIFYIKSSIFSQTIIIVFVYSSQNIG